MIRLGYRAHPALDASWDRIFGKREVPGRPETPDSPFTPVTTQASGAAVLGMAVVMDPEMPEGEAELRSGDQRVRVVNLGREP